MLLRIRGQSKFSFAHFMGLKRTPKLNILQFQLFFREPTLLVARDEIINSRGNRPRVGIIEILQWWGRRTSHRCKPHSSNEHRSDSLEPFDDECDDFRTGSASNPVIIDDA